jgi:hypothetical protein
MLVVTHKNGSKAAYQMSIADITNMSDAMMGTLRPARKLVFKRFLTAIQDVKRIHSFEAKKHCPGCGNAHNLNGFQSLPCVGDMVDDVEILELRNCPCGSTIAWTLYSTDPETINELEQ